MTNHFYIVIALLLFCSSHFIVFGTYKRKPHLNFQTPACFYRVRFSILFGEEVLQLLFWSDWRVTIG